MTPEIQIEQVPILTDSIFHTIKKQGFTLSDEKFDIESGQRFYNVYKFGNVVKRIIFQSDNRESIKGN